MWNASSEQELLQRPMTPFSTATQTRLNEYRTAFRNGEHRLEGWTLFPKGVATTVLCRMRGVSLDGHPEAMLVEIQSDSLYHFPPVELRALEALRHTPLMISLFSQDGGVLMRNPAATACFADLDRTLGDGGDHFRAMFASDADHSAMTDGVVKDVPVRRNAVMALPGGPVHALHVTLVSDPVTGMEARLVAQEDVSLVVEMHRQLADSEDALDAVLASNLVPVVILSTSDNRLLRANLSARQRIGPALVRGVPSDFIFARDEDLGALRDAVLSGRGGVAQALIRTEDGRGFWASLTGVRIVYEKQDAMVILLTDVDTVYRTAEDLEAALSLERTTGEMQRRFLAIASHEFRTPLALIDSVAQRLARAAETMTPDQIRGRAQRIRGTVQRLVQLLETIIDRARDNRTALGYVAGEADLGAVIGEVVADFHDHHPAVKLEVMLPPLPLLRIDTALMKQAIGNLLSNSEKYAGDEQYITITATVTSEDVQIFIRDRGIGIPPEERARVFSDYVRGSNVGTRPGTGLGLAIVSQIIGLHGGMIEVIDQDGPGTTMRISLPRP